MSTISPLWVYRRPDNDPGGVGPCLGRCARSSRRGGVEIDGAETVLWTCLFGLQLAAQVAEVVSLEDIFKGFNIFLDLRRLSVHVGSPGAGAQ